MKRDEDKTKEQLINELMQMREWIKQAEASETERKRLEHHLAERVKELQCVYSISSIAERSYITNDELYQEVADLLPDAWQYPEITCARVIINNKRFETENWRETEWKQSSDIKVHEVKAGTVEICYLEERPSISEGPFLIEERRLIDAVAQRLGKITERRQMEEALRQGEERFRVLTETASDWVWEVDADGVYTYASPKVKDLLGYEPEEVIGKTPFDLMPPEEAERITVEFRAIVESQRPFAGLENTNLHKDGRLIVLETSGVPFFGDDGWLCGYRGIDRDITERKQLEQVQMERAAALARMEEVQQSRQRIIAMQESLRRDIAQQIHGTVQNRLIILTHRLADLEKSSLSEQTAAEVADLHQKFEELLEGYVRPISHRLFPSILRRGLVPALQSLVDQFETVQSVDMQLSEELKRQERINPRLITERVRLAVYRIAEEALVNATKHANASRITVELGPSSQGWLRLMVRDDGRGFNVESASASLGILMMQDYAEVMGGSCVISSTPGRGTEVTATIPLAEPEAEYPETA